MASNYTDRDYELQRTERLLDAINDWRTSVGKPQHERDRRHALKLLFAERRRRDQMRMQLRAAADAVGVRNFTAGLLPVVMSCE